MTIVGALEHEGSGKEEHSQLPEKEIEKKDVKTESKDTLGCDFMNALTSERSALGIHNYTVGLLLFEEVLNVVVADRQCTEAKWP